MSTTDYPQRAFAHVRKDRNPLSEDFARVIEDKLEKFKVPSLTIAIVDGDETYSAGYGFAELPATKATPATVYMTGSTTKSFTALSILQLVEAQITPNAAKTPITLQSPVSSLLPGFALSHEYLSQAATLEDILSHRTGLPAHNEAYFQDHDTLEDLLKRLPHLPLTAEPRTKWQYNNLMYEVASATVTRLSGLPFRDYMKEKIWGKLNMDRTFLRLKDAQDFVRDSNNSTEPQKTEVLAHGYFWDPDRREFLRERWMDTPTITGSGHTLSTVLDYAKYLRAMIDGAKGVISEASKTELRTERCIMPVAGDRAEVGISAYTLGWNKHTYPPGLDLYDHTGTVGGFGAYMAYVPALRWGVAIFANSALSSTLLEAAVCRHLLDEKLGVPIDKRLDHFEPAEKQLNAIVEAVWNQKPDSIFPDMPGKRVPKSVAIEAYAGEYKSPGYGSISLKLIDDDGERILQSFGEYATAGKVEVAESRTLRLERLTKSPWNFIADFEHASGEAFLLKCRTPEDDPHLIEKYLKAEFCVGADGVVQKVGILWDSDDPLVWYQKVQEGNVEETKE
ncbi:beta-lactamase/transpeptidase-like protein [Xylariales sp. PMI_506]|nr:beta-lactamase/transpeptidase-like protein [Xylariales sp. PMI_506]